MVVKIKNRDESPDAEYVVMDSRAQMDTNKASILEACGKRQPSWKSLQKDWGNQQAVLVRWSEPVDGVYTKEEVVGVIR